LYRFDLTPALFIDYEVANRYVSTHPESHFRKNLMLARTAPGRRYALTNRSLSIHHTNGRSEQRELVRSRAAACADKRSFHRCAGYAVIEPRVAACVLLVIPAIVSADRRFASPGRALPSFVAVTAGARQPACS
jgi:hypothetical protein